MKSILPHDLVFLSPGPFIAFIVHGNTNTIQVSDKSPQNRGRRDKQTHTETSTSFVLGHQDQYKKNHVFGYLLPSVSCFSPSPVLLPARSAVTGRPSWQRALPSILGSKALLLVAKLDILDIKYEYFQRQCQRSSKMFLQ